MTSSAPVPVGAADAARRCPAAPRRAAGRDTRRARWRPPPGSGSGREATTTTTTAAARRRRSRAPPPRRRTGPGAAESRPPPGTGSGPRPRPPAAAAGAAAAAAERRRGSGEDAGRGADERRVLAPPDSTDCPGCTINRPQTVNAQTPLLRLAVFIAVASTYITVAQHTHNTVSPRGRRDDMPPADDSSTAAKIAADLRPSTDGSAVRTSLVAVGG